MLRNMYDIKTSYFSYYQMTVWKNDYTLLFNEMIRNSNISKIKKCMLLHIPEHTRPL